MSLNTDTFRSYFSTIAYLYLLIFAVWLLLPTTTLATVGFDFTFLIIDS